MEYLDEILFNDKLNDLYSDICKDGIPIPIKLQTVSKEGGKNAAGHCQLINEPSQELYINIKIREDRITEEIVSHELLHAKHIKNGYNGGISCMESNSIIERIGESVNNILEHVMIYEEQDSLYISRDEGRIIEQMLEYGSDKMEKSNMQTILSALAILESNIRGGQSYEELISKIKDVYPTSYSIALEMFKLIDIQELKNPFQFRRSLIKILSYLETIRLTDEKVSIIPFKKLIAVGFVPSERQLSQNVDQVFDVQYNYFNSKLTGVISKAENQLSFLLVQGSNDMKKLTLDEFFSGMRYTYKVREK